MEDKCAMLLNKTQSIANALVSGVTHSISSLGAKSIHDLNASSDPLWILGEKYNSNRNMEGILNDIRSRFWFTFRRNFPRIDNVGPNTDCTWGSMLRSGQMMMSQALIMKHFGRSWRWSSDKNELIKNGSYRRYLSILFNFIDLTVSTYSIQKIASNSATSNNPIGTWFGPNTVCQTLKKLADIDKENEVFVHVCTESLVIIDEIKRANWDSVTCEGEQSEERQWRDMILLIPLRLGVQEMDAGYHHGVKHTFHLPQSVGIIGGHAKQAFYAIGYVGNELIFLDPYLTQDAVDPQPLLDLDRKSDSKLANLAFDDSTYHTDNALRISFNKLDPSLALCFYFSSEANFDSWCDQAKDLLIRSVPMPLFEIFNERPYNSISLTTTNEDNDDGVANVTEGCSDHDTSAELESPKTEEDSEIPKTEESKTKELCFEDTFDII